MDSINLEGGFVKIILLATLQRVVPKVRVPSWYPFFSVGAVK